MLVDMPPKARAPACGLLPKYAKKVWIAAFGSERTCARCLAEFDRTVEVAVSELVSREPGPDDDYRFEEDLHLDPEPIVRDAVGLELPFAPLCRPDCQGICPSCGADRNVSPCSCAAPIDPRWRALEAFGEDRPVP